MGAYFDSVVRLTSECETRLQTVCTEIAQYASDNGKPAEIVFSLTDDLTLSAYSEKVHSYSSVATRISGGKYRIVISSGFLIRLAYAFEIYSDIWLRFNQHLPKGPIHVPIHFDQSDRRVRNIDFVNTEAFRIVRPLFVEEGYDDKKRKEDINAIDDSGLPFSFRDGHVTTMARSCMEKALEFLVLHECAHIVRGHLEYLDTTYNIRALPERVPQSFPLDTEMHHQMEFDADCNTIVNLLRPLVHKGRKKETANVPFSEMLAFFLIIGTVFSMFHCSLRTTSSYIDKSHPDPDLRYVTSIAYATVAFGGIVDKGLEPFLAEMSTKAVEYIVHANRQLGIVGGGFNLLLVRDDFEVKRRFDGAARDILLRGPIAQEKWTDRARPGSHDLLRRGDS
jgi:hypothetical protein